MESGRFRLPDKQSANIYCVNVVTIAGVCANEKGMFARSYFVPYDISAVDFMDDALLSEFDKSYPIGFCLGSVSSKTMVKWYYDNLLNKEERENLGFSPDELSGLDDEEENWK